MAQNEAQWRGQSLGNHDLSLPAWGPYGKELHGLSHIADLQRGLRFDLGLAPGLYRRGIRVPAVAYESGSWPCAAASDGSSWQWHYELCENASMTLLVDVADEQKVFLQAQFNNDGDVPLSAVLHLLPSLHFPPLGKKNSGLAAPTIVRLPSDDVQWLGAESYADLGYARPDCRDRLPYDGHLRGSVRDPEFVDGIGIGNRGWNARCFAGDVGDFLTWDLSSSACSLIHYGLRIRYSGRAHLEIDGVLHTVDADGWHIIYGTREPGTTLCVRSAGDHPGGIAIDGVLLAPTHEALAATQFQAQQWSPVPTVHHSGHGRYYLQWADLEQGYGIACDAPEMIWRDIHGSGLDPLLAAKTHDHVSRKLVGHGEGWHGDIFIYPVHIAAHSSEQIQICVCMGTDQQRSEDELARWMAQPIAKRQSWVADAERRLWRAGNHDPHRGIQHLAATTLTNVVFPVETRGQWIRHHTPGRNWDSLYTWDSGFIALGLAELDHGRALDCIDAYLVEPENTDCAFIHHGTPLPTQIWAAKTLIDQTQDRQLAAWLLPRLDRQYRWLIGNWPSSSNATFKSGLLRTWDVFYNSGGWDDYPPQWWLYRHQQHNHEISPVVITAQAQRCARILSALAIFAGVDHGAYEADVQRFAEILERAWNEGEGVYSYMWHDAEGNASRPLLDPVSGKDFNHGMDGLSPLVGGCLDGERASRLFAALKDPARYRSPHGLSTVDMSAPYYSVKGYWNGTIWFPHQYFFWDACLNWGETDLAWWIAQTALRMWQDEVGQSGMCFEHFAIATGRGAGWHHFSGLSTPILRWHGAYYGTGRIEVGSDVLIEQQAVQDGVTQAQLRIIGRREGTTTIIIPGYEQGLALSWNGEVVSMHRTGAAWSVLLPRAEELGTLRMEAVEYSP